MRKMSTEHTPIFPIWRCSCGEVNSTVNSFCSKCSRSQHLLNYIDPCACCAVRREITEVSDNEGFDFLVRDLVRY